MSSPGQGHSRSQDRNDLVCSRHRRETMVSGAQLTEWEIARGGWRGDPGPLSAQPCYPGCTGIPQAHFKDRCVEPACVIFKRPLWLSCGEWIGVGKSGSGDGGVLGLVAAGDIERSRQMQYTHSQ